MSGGKAIVPLVRIGDPAPGGGAVMLLGNHVVNDGGAVTYFAGVSGAAATQAIFRTDGTRTTTIARDDIAPPWRPLYLLGEPQHEQFRTGGVQFRDDGDRRTMASSAAPAVTSLPCSSPTRPLLEAEPLRTVALRRSMPAARSWRSAC